MLHVRDGLRGVARHLSDRAGLAVSGGSGWQYAVIGVAVIASGVVTARQLAPAWAARRQTALAERLAARRHPALRWLGRRLAAGAAAGGGCGSGCSACGGCGTSGGPPPDESPLTFKPRAARGHAAETGARGR
nr:DUF6587 family protein [Burkholderia glumae]